jgi:hypothetical protein
MPRSGADSISALFEIDGFASAWAQSAAITDDSWKAIWAENCWGDNWQQYRPTILP